MFHRRKHNRAYGVTWDESTTSPAGVRVGQGSSAAVSSALPDNLAMLQRLMKGCVISDAGAVQYYLDPTTRTLKENGDPSVLTGGDGQVVVEITTGWLKYSYANNEHTWIISKEQFNGASRLDAFYKNGAWVDHRYCGAYEGVLYDVSAARYTNGLQLVAGSTDFVNATSAITRTGESHPFSRLEVGDKIVVAGTTHNDGTFTVATAGDQTIIVTVAPTQELAVGTATIETEKDFTASSGDKLCSVSGKTPINDLTRANGRTISVNRGAGWRQQDYDLMSAVQLLYLVEYADFYSQSMIGNGLTDWAGATWDAWNAYNPIETTGNSNANGNATANTSGGDGIIGSYMSYRGIENLFGHIWGWCDGININNNAPYVSNNDSDFADDTVTNYTDLGITIANDAANGYQNTLEQQARGILPATCTGASGTTKVTDNYYQAAGWRVVRLGGDVGFGAFAGAFCLLAGDSSSYVTRGIGVRLAF